MAEYIERDRLLAITPATVGESIRAARVKLGMQQKELANIAGVSAWSISKYETGKGLPTLYTAICIADAIGMTLDELIGRKDE